MDQTKCRPNLPPPKATQTKMPDKVVKDDFICVFRERDLLRNQVHSSPDKSPLGIFNRIKRKIGNLTRDN